MQPDRHSQVGQIPIRSSQYYHGGWLGDRGLAQRIETVARNHKRMPRKKKPELNFNMQRIPGEIRDPLDQMLKFIEALGCHAKGDKLLGQDGSYLCSDCASTAEVWKDVACALTAVNKLPELVRCIRELRKSVDSLLSKTPDTEMIDQALLDANRVLYELRTHWQAAHRPKPK